jgi:hypothetical protein
MSGSVRKECPHDAKPPWAACSALVSASLPSSHEFSGGCHHLALKQHMIDEEKPNLGDSEQP